MSQIGHRGSAIGNIQAIATNDWTEGDMIKKDKPKSRVRTWIRRFFVCWSILAVLYLGNMMRTQGVDAALLRSDEIVEVVTTTGSLTITPQGPAKDCSLVFICGSGVAAEAYVPMLRPIAEAGYPTYIVKLPWRFGPLESHKQQAIDRAIAIMKEFPDRRWVAAGHSLGGALTARLARDHESEIDGIVLIGTTHPKEDDLSALMIPVTKVFGANDGVAPAEKVDRNRDLLPKHTRFVELRGGNHSQFGHYGHQLMDGDATITREEQQASTRDAILQMLANVAG